jgi:hypothetical protein
LQNYVAQRAALLARVPSKMVMEFFRYIFDLNIGHAQTLACQEHAGNLNLSGAGGAALKGDKPYASS